MKIMCHVNYLIIVLYLGFNPIKLRQITIDQLNIYTKKIPYITPSLTFINIKDPANHVRVKITKIIISSNYPTYWNGIYYFYGRFNPSIAYWNNKLLMGWRTYTYNSDLKFSWVFDSLEGIDINSTYLGLGYNTDNIGDKNRFYLHREDPRLMVLSNGSLFVSYSFRSKETYGFTNCYFIITKNSNNIAQFSLSYEIQLPLGKKGSPHEKNWMAFEYNKEILMIESLNPLHIIKIDESLPDVNGTRYATTIVKEPYNPDFGYIGKDISTLHSQ